MAFAISVSDFTFYLQKSKFLFYFFDFKQNLSLFFFGLLFPGFGGFLISGFRVS